MQKRDSERLEAELKLLSADVRSGDDFPSPGVVVALRKLNSAIAARCRRFQLVTDDAGEVRQNRSER